MKTTLGLEVGFRTDVGSHVVALAWWSDQLVAATIEGPIVVIDRHGETRRLAGHQGGTLSAAVAPDRAELASGGQDGQVRWWSLPDGQPIASAAGGAAWIERLCYSPDGRWLATTAGRVPRIWPSPGGTPRELAAQPSTIADIAWLRGRGKRAAQQLVTAAYGQIALYTPTRDPLEPEQVLSWSGSTVRLACSPDGRYIATGDQDRTVHFWRPEVAHLPEFSQGSQMSGFPRKVLQLAWDATSRWLATGGSENVCMWDCAPPGPEQRKPAMFVISGAPVSALNFQRQGRLLAAGDRDGAILVRDVSGTATSQLPLFAAEVCQIAWRSDERAFAAASAAGEVALCILA
jgi:WD40 repeat protein